MVEIAYERRTKRSRRLTLEESGDGAVLSFPVLHPFWHFLQIASVIVQIAGFTFGILMIVYFYRALGIPIDSAAAFHLIPAVAMYAAEIIVMSLLCAYFIVWYVKYGHTPKRLGFDQTSLTRTWAGWRGMRLQEWPLENIESVKLVPLKSIVPPWIAANLIIRIRGRRRRMQFRLGGQNVGIGKRFVELLEHAIATHRPSES